MSNGRRHCGDAVEYRRELIRFPSWVGEGGFDFGESVRGRRGNCDAG